MKLIMMSLMIVTIFGCSKPNLKIRIEKSEFGTAYLLNTINQKMDTIVYKDHAFIFAENLDEPTLYHLYFEEIKNWSRPIYMILSKEMTQIKFDSLIAPNETASSFSSYYPNVPRFIKDPNLNESFYQFQSIWISFSDSIMSMSSNEQELVALKTIRENLYNGFILKCGEIISENKDKVVSAFILEYLMNNKFVGLNKIQEYYSVLDTTVQKSEIGQRISKESGFNNNSKAPMFEFKDMDGNDYNLNKLKNKKVLLHFWSTTCAPCIKEIPTLSKLNDDRKDLIIINISLDTDSIRWYNGVAKLGMNRMINTCDFQGTNGRLARDYHINAIPAYYLISAQGEIISKRQTFEEIQKDIN